MCEFTAKDDTRRPILISCTDCRSFTKLNMLRFLLKYNGIKRVLWRETLGFGLNIFFFITRHDKGIRQSKKLCLALSIH